MTTTDKSPPDERKLNTIQPSPERLQSGEYEHATELELPARIDGINRRLTSGGFWQRSLVSAAVYPGSACCADYSVVGTYMAGFGAIIPVSVCERAVVNDELNNANSGGSRVVKMRTVSLDVFIAGLL